MPIVAKPNLKRKPMNRYEKATNSREKKEYALRGKGLFEYRNNTSGDLMLPKPSASGSRVVPKGATFRGDDYFMYMVRVTNEAKLVRVIEETVEPVTEKPMSEQKLILDQPDKVTTEGKIEHVVKKLDKPVKLNEGQPAEQKKEEDVLLNDSPVDGVEIC